MATVAELAGLIVQWQHTVRFGFAPPESNHLLQLFGMSLGQVVDFGAIVVDVVELPLVAIKRQTRVTAVVGKPHHRMKHDRFPAVVIQGPRAHHLEILREMFGGYIWLIQRVGKTHTFDGRL